MKERSRTAYSFLNIFSGTGGYAINVLVSFLCRMVFARCLNEEYFGISGLFANIISMLSLTELGIGTAIVYALYKPIARKDNEKTASIMKLYGTAYKIIGLSVAVIGVALIPFLDFIIKEKPNIKENLVVIYLLYLFSTVSSYFFSYRATIITASQRVYVINCINYAVVIVQNLIQILILILTKNFIIYLAAQIVCSLITGVIIWFKAGHDYPYIKNSHAPPLSKEEKTGIFKNVRDLSVYKLSGLLVNNTDNIVITYFNGLVTTGAASNYILLSSMLNSLLAQVFSGITAGIGNVNVTESDELKYKFFKRLNLANFWLFGWATIGIAALSSSLVELFFGRTYVLSDNVAVIIAVNFYILGMQNAVLAYKSTMGLFRYGRSLLLVTAAINIAGDIVLGKYFGMMGIFAATAISRLATNAWYEPYAIYKHGFGKNPAIYLKIYLKYTLVLLLAGAPCFLINTVTAPLPFAAALAIKTAACIIIPNLVFFLVFFRTDEFRYIKDVSLSYLAKVPVLSKLKK